MDKIPRDPDELLACSCGWAGPARAATLVRSERHIEADCPDCGRYIKFVSHEAPTLYFGKYRGQTVEQVAATDRPYLAWLVSANGPKLSQNLRRAVETSLRS